ncbi:hypothetical protein [Endozoicomonas ascidiicola]|uniref:hypothetical protein n=1 Tax=Endozoicomonas ascidiicola TaxID=1698521 RepID=UPI000831D361|nr:hypothetical protein [Endozoicomonas ascidiicola]
MNTFTIEGWKKKPGAFSPTPINNLHFRINDHYHLLLEQAEESLLDSDKEDVMFAIDMETMELQLPRECGSLADCQLRVYLSQQSQRGQFHLVAHCAEDNSLVYSNAVMIDQLG